jgi:hypothetical protein
MTVTDFHELVQYVTDAAGEKTGVLVPLAVWEDLMQSWQALLNLQMDDDEPKAEILAELKASIRQARAGETLPLSELWDGIDDE